MTKEMQAALNQGCPLSEILRMASSRPAYAARDCAAEIEALDMEQTPPWERARWSPSFMDEVVRIIARHFPVRP